MTQHLLSRERNIILTSSRCVSQVQQLVKLVRGATSYQHMEACMAPAAMIICNILFAAYWHLVKIPGRIFC